MTRAILLLIFSRLFVLLVRRTRPEQAVLQPHGEDRSVSPRFHNSYRLSADVCRCRLREVLRAYHGANYRIEGLGMDSRRLHAIRAGHAEPTLEEKVLIIRGINDFGPRSRRPRVEYDEVFGARATASVCSCEVRRLLDAHELTASDVAKALDGVTRKDVLAWRAGYSQPTSAQLEQLRALAAGRRVVSFVPAAQRRRA